MGIERLGEAAIIAVGGELDVTNYLELVDFADAVLEPLSRQVVLELSGLTFMDCCGVRGILMCRDAVVKRGGALWIAAVHGNPARLLAITGIDTGLVVHETVGQALSATGGGAVQP
ncbi:STAS domain-containing protein [Nonomuraea sp. NPDC002799]